MFLGSYQDIVFNGKLLSSYTPGILNLGINHRKRTRFGQLACPSCLSKDIPFYRKEWRLFFSTGCSKCQCYLIDKCEKCLSPIAFHRLENGYKETILEQPLYVCFNCQYDLRKSTRFYKKDSLIDTYQRTIDNTINKGYNHIDQYSFSYFLVLLNLMRLLTTSSKKWNRVKLAVEFFFEVKLKTRKELNPIDELEDRRIKLTICHQLLDDWPVTFTNVFKQSNVRLSDFTRECFLPFWFVKVIKNFN